MKKSFLLLSVAALLWSCSSEEPVTVDKFEEGKVSNYLSIKLRTANVVPSRADNTYNQGDGTYEDGSSNESNVDAVRLYFFDKDGNAAKAFYSGGQYSNFWDWTDIDTVAGNHTQTVEETILATVVPLTMDEMEEKPAYIVAIANPTADIINNVGTTVTEQNFTGLNLVDLTGKVANYLDNLHSDNFVMTNSVYVDGGEVVNATPINPENFQPTAQQALETPVTIYIERVLARVDFGLDMEPADDMADGVEGTFYTIGSYRVEDYNEATGETTSSVENIYLQLLGWNVTTTTNVSRLVKDVKKDWVNSTIMGANGTLWNSADYHRSFWAINPPVNGVNGNPNLSYNYGTFGTETDGVKSGTGLFAMSLDIPEEGEFTKTYLQENAAPAAAPTAGPTNPSQVIIAAQLVDKNGVPFTLCQWGSYKYTLSGLQNAVANVSKLYYYDENAVGENKYVKIKPSMITFQQVSATEGEENNFAVYPVLTDAAQSKTWYLPNGTEFTAIQQGSYTSLSEAVNAELKTEIGPVQIWNTGKTYYYFDIRHLGYDANAGDEQQNIGAFGIVRNHIYRTTVTSIAGLGTPVYKPDEVIYPEHANPSETSLAVKIEVLSWRVVSQSYELEW